MTKKKCSLVRRAPISPRNILLEQPVHKMDCLRVGKWQKVHCLTEMTTKYIHVGTGFWMPGSRSYCRFWVYKIGCHIAEGWAISFLLCKKKSWQVKKKNMWIMTVEKTQWKFIQTKIWLLWYWDSTVNFVLHH